MKNKFRKLRLITPLILFAAMANTLLGQGIPIKGTLFAQNAWQIDVKAAGNATELDSLLTKVQASGVKYMRIGGIASNFSPTYSWSPSYTISTANLGRLKYLIDTLRKCNIEPIVQVGFCPITTPSSVSPLSNIGRANQATIAGELVKRINKQDYVANPIKYWIIANEPDIPPKNVNYFDSLGGYTYNTLGAADSICKYISDFAAAMKGQDSTIKIIGPELATFGNDSNYTMNKVMAKLLSSPTNTAYSIMGKVPGMNKYKIDVLSFHQYITPANKSSVIANPTYSANGFRSNLTTTVNLKEGIIDMLSNSGRSIDNLKLACTEVNIDVKNNLSETTSYTNVIKSYDNRSFIGGQWLADMFSQAMGVYTINPVTNQPESWIEIFAPWSVKEGGCSEGKGYLSHCTTYTGRKRPMYEHYKLVAENFIGRYYAGKSNNSNVKTFASAETPYGFKIMVINQDTATDFNLQINMAGVTNTTANYPLTITFTLQNDPALNFTASTAYLTPTVSPILKSSTRVLTFDCAGNFIKAVDYTIDDAIGNEPPGIVLIGDNPVDPTSISCSQTNTIGGTVTTSTTYANYTVGITSDLILGTNATLGFTNCLIVMSPRTKIYGESKNALTFKKCLIVGCEGATWNGIELIGSYNAAESIKMDSCVIVNADYPVHTDKILSVILTNNFFVNGLTAVTLDECKGFTFTDNFVGGFNSGVSTRSSVANYTSFLMRNYFTEIDTAAKFQDDGHDKLQFNCNRIEFKQFGLYVNNSTTLAAFGTATTGAGNKFTLMTSLTPDHFIQNEGPSVNYYYDPIFASTYSNSVMSGITTLSASANATCPAVITDTCMPWYDIGIVENVKSGESMFNVYPNPSSGNFTVSFKEGNGLYNIEIFDLMGRRVMERNVNFTTEKNVVLEIQSKGMYFVSLRNNDRRMTKKVIVE